VDDGFRYQVTTRCPAPVAAAVLADITHQVQVHPLIESVDQVAAPPGVLRGYRVTDRVRLGPIALRVVYQADLLSASDHEIVSVARQRPGIVVRNRTTLSDRADGGTDVTVEITVSAPWPLFGFTLGQARRAHAEVARRLGPLLDRSA
jgi:hypothetical protein